jgi:hypothetical protein
MRGHRSLVVSTLGDGSDIGGFVGRRVGGVGSNRRWRVEYSVSQVLEQPDAVGVMVRPRQLREARSRTAQTRDRQEASAGSRPITLTRRRVSPKGRSMKLGAGSGGGAPAGTAGTW